MENFTRFIPTKLHFGKDVTQKIGSVTKSYGRKILLIYGKGSIKNNGIYDDVVGSLKKSGCQIFEYSGIKANPVIEDVDGAVRLANNENIDVIVAVGGGSVIDTAKIVSVAMHYSGPAWDIVSGHVRAKKATPLVAVLTLAATGTEMNAFAVVQNHNTNEKVGYGAPPHTYPQHSFLDPAYTLSVPKDQTTNGIVDLIAHCLEAYFGAGDASLSDRFVFDIIKEAMEYGPQLLDKLSSYDLRARIMHAATMALNGVTSLGRSGSGDWGVHSIGHTLSLLYDVSHGASLSIAFPAWMKYHLDDARERLDFLFFNLFGTKDAEKGIKMLEDFFQQIGSPIRLSDLKIDNIDSELILNTMNRNAASGSHFNLNDDSRKMILELMK